MTSGIHGRGSASALAAFLVLASATCSAPSERPPNIILVLVDTFRADHLGSYGFEGDISPHLGGLAAESVLFQRRYSQAPWTPPSMGTLFTSLYPQVHGLNSFREQKFVDPESGVLRATVLPDEAVTLAEVLQKAGYRTAAFVTNPWIEASLGMGQGYDLYHDERTGRHVPADEIRDFARRWLQSRSDDRPFFLYLHFMVVHGPWDAPRRDCEALKDHVAGENRLLQPSEIPAGHASGTPRAR